MFRSRTQLAAIIFADLPVGLRRIAPHEILRARPRPGPGAAGSSHLPGDA